MRIIQWFRRCSVEREMREEMEFHLESRMATLVSRGMTREEAARTARIEFGSPEARRDECREVLGYRPWDELRADLRFAARGVRNHPGFSATAIAILAVAIGANSAFFTLFSHYVLKPLAIRGVERHFDLNGLDRSRQRTGGWTAAEIDTLRLASHQQVEGLYTYRLLQMLVLEPGQRLGLIGFVSGNYFRLLSGPPAAGRALSEAEQSSAVAVLSRSGQLRHFPGDPSPIGKTLRVRTTVFTVIGVMPAEFTGSKEAIPDFWTGADMYLVLNPEPDASEHREGLSGLVAQGVSLQQAEAALTAAAIHLPRRREEAVARVRLVRRASAMDVDDDGLRVAVGVVFVVFLLVLAIACANLANLYLSRAASRSHEITTRLSLGASRFRIVRQLLTESIFISLLGASGGVAFGVLAVQQAQRYVGAIAGGVGLVMAPFSTDWRVLLFSACLGILAGLAFGLLPALEVTSPSLSLAVRRDSAFAGRVSPRRMRNLLVGGQVAAGLVLLLIAGVLVRHLQTLTTISPGYDLDHIFDLRRDRAQPALLALLQQERGVAAVTAVARVPLYGQLDHHPATAGGRSFQLSYNYVDHRYFETLALPVEGRAFNAAEAAGNVKVVVISRRTAAELWPNTSPLGNVITIDHPRAEDARAAGTYQVIGVVPDVVNGWLFQGKERAMVYFPAAAGQERIDSTLVRINGPSASALTAIRKLCAAVPNATGCEPTSLREVADFQRWPFEAAAMVAGALGALALMLTAVGLYSVTSYSVVQRRREIGVHLALGASPAQLTRRLVGEAWRCVAGGLAVGLPISLALSRLANSSVLGINAFDPAAYAAVPVLLAVIVTLACAGPARRAARMDPMASLREE